MVQSDVAEDEPSYTTIRLCAGCARPQRHLSAHALQEQEVLSHARAPNAARRRVLLARAQPRASLAYWPWINDGAAQRRRASSAAAAIEPHAPLIGSGCRVTTV
mmetsp:Transcript_41322/g.96605  ORF Transcript_41322/g.96605 Transcript_41322/m.96605 type:complete len:104 (+) Transcript_41322:308-619(+)